MTTFGKKNKNLPQSRKERKGDHKCENGGVGVQDFEPVQQNYEKALQLKCIATLGQGY